MAKLTQEQLRTRIDVRGMREVNRNLDGKAGLDSSDYDQNIRDQAAAANRSARDAARKAAREARERKRGRSGAFRTVAQQDEFTVPDAPDLNKPVDAKYTDGGEVDTSGLKDDQIINMGGGKFARYDSEIDGLTDVEFSAEQNRFVVPETSTGPTAGQKTVIQSMPSIISAVQRYAGSTGDTAMLGDVQKLQREMDAVNTDTSLDEDMRTEALLGLQGQARDLQERMQSAQAVATQAEAVQRLQEAQNKLVLDTGVFAQKLEEKFQALDVGHQQTVQTNRQNREASNPATAQGGSMLQQQFAAYQQQTAALIKTFDENAAQGLYPNGPNRPVMMSYENFARARMTEHHIQSATQDAVLPMQLAYDRNHARRELLVQHLSQADTFIESVVGMKKPDGTVITRLEAIDMFDERTAPQQMALVAVEAEMERLSNSINRELEQGRIMNPGAPNPITLRELQMYPPEARSAILYERTHGEKPPPLTQASTPQTAQGSGRVERRVNPRTPTVGQGSAAMELPLTMMGRELEAGKDITETGGYDVSYKALAANPSEFRPPNPQEQSIVTTEEYEAFVNAPQHQRDLDAAFKSNIRDIGNRLLTIYAQSGQRAVSREAEFQAEQQAKESTLAAGKANPVAVATTGQAFSPR
tara:strand:+ start:7683 stop:9611 length:1929 start_codon:yes stop_codon:yes gene_type:complete